MQLHVTFNTSCFPEGIKKKVEFGKMLKALYVKKFFGSERLLALSEKLGPCHLFTRQESLGDEGGGEGVLLISVNKNKKTGQEWTSAIMIQVTLLSLQVHLHEGLTPF